MKNIKVIIAVSMILAFISCERSNPDCIDIEYNQNFTIEENSTYCLPDGNYLEIDSLKNLFCPCNVACLWEGEMLLYYTASFDGSNHSGFVGSSFNTNNSLGIVPYELIINDVQFEEPCTEFVPSPDIDFAIGRIIKD